MSRRGIWIYGVASRRSCHRLLHIISQRFLQWKLRHIAQLCFRRAQVEGKFGVGLSLAVDLELAVGGSLADETFDWNQPLCHGVNA
jgi:hypothetical protein